MSYTQDEFDNSSLNHPNNQDKEKKRDEMAGIHEDRPGTNGLAGLVKNPYVFCTAIFASIGGILFGCKLNPFFPFTLSLSLSLTYRKLYTRR